jgi:hypothetical protein
MNLKKYEYKIVEATAKSKWQGEMDIDANENILIGLGLDGWELVQVYEHQLNNGLKSTLFFFKRELPPEDLV